jgi:adenylosuccinate synthase
MTTNIKVIIGCNAGDEGKGLVTDYFTYQSFLLKQNCLVVLSNGGSQRGHTVTLPSGERHVFRHFGSGSFLGAYTYLPKYYVVNPMNWMEEYRQLIAKGIKLRLLLINENCPLTTPYDMIANQMIEESRVDKRHGSCGVGIWETIFRDGITVGEMFQKTDNEKAEYLRFVRDVYFTSRISSKGIKPDRKWESIINSKALIDNYIYDFNCMIAKSVFTTDDVLNHFDNVIFENGQGLFLDQNIQGYGKHTTPSNTGLQNPAEMIHRIAGDKNVEVCYVSRTYMTRHGAGRFDTECRKDIISSTITQDLTNQTHAFQGRLRYGVLDWNEVEKMAIRDFEKFGSSEWKVSFFFTHANECSLPSIYNPHNYFTYISDNPTRNNVNTTK